MFGIDQKGMRTMIEYLLHLVVVALIAGAAMIGSDGWWIVIFCFGLLLVMITYLLLQILQRLER